jgi:ABC-type Fe3+-hydroxamate transport system substrate-binding protein
LLTTAGGENVFADVKRENLQASVETLLTRAPQVILELRTSGSSSDQLGAERDVWKRLASLPAVRSDRIHMLTDPSLSIPGPRIAAAARAFAAALHP